MANINLQTIQRFVNLGENDLSTDSPFLVDRLSIPVVANIASYLLPDYVISIRRITYKGRKLSPLDFRQQRENFYGAQIMGRPYWYVYNNMGLSTIKLFPTPTEPVAQVNNVWTTDIPNGVIVEFFRIPGTHLPTVSIDSLWGATLWGGGSGALQELVFQLPEFIRRQLLKQFVAYKSYQIESANQNMKLVNYFSGRWEKKKKEFISLVNELHNKPRKLMISGINANNIFPGAPLLPIDRYGTSVEEGY